MIKSALILAGGKGERLYPITLETQKVLLPVKQKPILERHLNNLEKIGATNVFLALGVMAEQIQNFVKSRKKDGFFSGMNFTFFVEEQPLGTGGPLNALKEKGFDEEFFMFNGDNLTDIDLGKMQKFHKEKKAFCSIALKECEDFANFGTVKMNGDKIIEFREKGNPVSKLVNAGAYILNPKIFELIPKGKSMIEIEAFPKLAQEGKLWGYKFKEQWFAVDDFERYETAIKNWKEKGNK